MCLRVCVLRTEGTWPQHHCKVPDGALLNETIPKEKDGSYTKCLMYDADDRNKTIKCNEWEYFGYIGDTIVSEVIQGSMLCWQLYMYRLQHCLE